MYEYNLLVLFSAAHYSHVYVSRAEHLVLDNQLRSSSLGKTMLLLVEVLG